MRLFDSTVAPPPYRPLPPAINIPVVSTFLATVPGRRCGHLHRQHGLSGEKITFTIHMAGQWKSRLPDCCTSGASRRPRPRRSRSGWPGSEGARHASIA